MFSCARCGMAWPRRLFCLCFLQLPSTSSPYSIHHTAYSRTHTHHAMAQNWNETFCFSYDFYFIRDSSVVLFGFLKSNLHFLNNACNYQLVPAQFLYSLMLLPCCLFSVRCVCVCVARDFIWFSFRSHLMREAVHNEAAIHLVFDLITAVCSTTTTAAAAILRDARIAAITFNKITLLH